MEINGFLKFGRYRSFVFPQFKSNPVNGFEIELPKIGAMKQENSTARKGSPRSTR
jgi:hypothetical protein